MYHLVLLGKENNLYVLDGDKDSIEMMFELTGMSKSAEKTYRAIWMADVINRQITQSRIYDETLEGKDPILYGYHFDMGADATVTVSVKDKSEEV